MRTSYRLRFHPGAILGMACLLMLGACQTTTDRAGRADAAAIVGPASVYSGYFLWDSERDAGASALQCLRIVFTGREELPDGRLRYTGVSRYVTGPESSVTYAVAELIYDPEAERFEMRESQPTTEDFVTDGVFRGEMLGGGLFLTGQWDSDAADGESGRLHLRSGADAPCSPDLPA